MSETAKSNVDTHYKVVAGEQHHARADRLNLNWYMANVTKYAERARLKGVFLDDMLKIIDYTIMDLETTTEGKHYTEAMGEKHRLKINELAKRLMALMETPSKPGYGSVLSNDADEAALRSYVNQDRSS